MPYGYYDKSYFSTMEQLNTTLSNIKTLRSSVRQIFEMLGNGYSSEEQRETKFLVELQEMLLLVNGNLRFLFYLHYFYIHIINIYFTGMLNRL